MLISAVLALALFAAPETTQSGDTAAQAPAAPAADAKPAMRKVCYSIEVVGSNLPKRKCRMEPVKAAPKAEAEKAPAETNPGA